MIRRNEKLWRLLPVLGLALAACGGKSGAKADGGAGAGGDATGAAGSGGAGTGGPAAPSLTDFQEASVVIGQPDFVTSAAPPAPGAASLDGPVGSAAFDGARLYLPDTYTNRVLGFSGVPTANGASATLSVGQAAFTSKAAGTTAGSAYLPQAVHASGAILAIADTGNNRLLLLPRSAAAGAAGGAVIVGWPSAATPSHGCAADRLESPARAFIGGGKLFVADRGNNRVLVWSTVPTTSGAKADLVIGQSTLTSCARNDSLRNGTTATRSAATLSGPTDVWSDGTRVMVADRGNNRVLLWSKVPTTNGAAADVVIGQTSFTLARDEAKSTTLRLPSALAVAGGMLFVADSGHNRVLGWSALPSANGAAANLVLGQGTFLLASPNDDAQAGTAGAAPTARTLAYPTGVAMAGDALVVSDTNNRRVLIYRGK